MATLARNGKTNYRASGIIVRDARHTHDDGVASTAPAKKDKRRWCRGKVGVEHNPTVVMKSISGILTLLVWCCATCGKERESFIPEQPGFKWLGKKPKPAWVIEFEAASKRIG